MAAKPIWNYVPPALIALNTLLVAENWYLRPQSAGVWFVVLLVLIGMTPVSYTHLFYTVRAFVFAPRFPSDLARHPRRALRDSDGW